MQTAPQKGQRYDVYAPQKYNCITVDDGCLENVVTDLMILISIGILLMLQARELLITESPLFRLSQCKHSFLRLKNVPELSELKALVQKAYAENKWIIHFGL